MTGMIAWTIICLVTVIPGSIGAVKLKAWLR